MSIAGNLGNVENWENNKKKIIDGKVLGIQPVCLQEAPSK
jgi:hypothetical protein